jgi:hypothetical protein
MKESKLLAIRGALIISAIGILSFAATSRCNPYFLTKDTKMPNSYDVHIIKATADSQTVVLSSGFKVVDTVVCKVYTGSGLLSMPSPYVNFKNWFSSNSHFIADSNLWENYTSYTKPTQYRSHGIAAFVCHGDDCYEFYTNDMKQSDTGSSVSYMWPFTNTEPITAYAQFIMTRVQIKSINVKTKLANYSAPKGSYNLKGQLIKSDKICHLGIIYPSRKAWLKINK